VTVLPMFPLGSVLLPSEVLPLHVFEPRYRRLVQDCQAADNEFGVVLIERGFEVGGGDVRSGVGTVARIVEVAETPDGRYALLAIGTDRLRVRGWAQDDPYPIADVERWPDGDDGARPEDVDRALADLRRLLALATDAGWSVGHVADALAGSVISDDPSSASFQLAAMAPFGPADRHRLLRCAGPGARLALLVELLGDVEAVIRFGQQAPP
jgi:uncharacterized protein